MLEAASRQGRIEEEMKVRIESGPLRDWFRGVRILRARGLPCTLKACFAKAIMQLFVLQGFDGQGQGRRVRISTTCLEEQHFRLELS